MSKYIEIRKQRTVGVKHKFAKVCLNLPKGEFRFYKQSCDLLEIDPEKEALMFHIAKKDKKVKIVVEEKEDDNYHLSNRKGYRAFTNKSLGIMFSEVFEFEMEGNFYFKFRKVKNEFTMTLIKDNNGK